MTNSEKIVKIRNAMIEPIRFNVDISYTEEGEYVEHNTKTAGVNWGEPKTEYFTGLLAAQVQELQIYLAVYGVEGVTRIHQVGKD